MPDWVHGSGPVPRAPWGQYHRALPTEPMDRTESFDQSERNDPSVRFRRSDNTVEAVMGPS
ncbi:hypothetical protein GCM10020254_86730 [Streptomyces goshikiensis]